MCATAHTSRGLFSIRHKVRLNRKIGRHMSKFKDAHRTTLLNFRIVALRHM
jgi:hypothetical protein